MKGKLIVVLLSLTLLAVISGPASAQFGSVSGRVTDGATGLPIMAAHVHTVGDSCHGGCGGAMTDSTGYYNIQHLRPGIYLVVASAFGYQEQVFPDSIQVLPGQDTPNIDFALTPAGGGAGSISGRVTDGVTGLPIVGAAVMPNGMHPIASYTDSAGYYTCANLPPGFYQVNAHAPGYHPEMYPTPVEVISGQNTPNIDFALAPEGGAGTGSISGRVTDSQTGLPIPMAHVWAYGDTNYYCCGGEGWTDTAGYYVMQHLTPGQYRVGVHKCGYQNAVYPQPVTVVAGQETPDIDFALVSMGEPGSISGSVADQQTGQPIRWAQVWAYGQFGHKQAHSDSLGQYTITGLYPGSYFVTAWAWGYEPQDYPDTINVIEGQNVPDINFALHPHGSQAQGVIAGQVSDDSTLSPITSAIVFAVSGRGNWGFAFTDSLGAYQIQRLQMENYYVFAFAPGYVGEFYDGVYTWQEATLVTPNANNIDFHLGTCRSEGASISGVVNSNASPVEGAFVYALVSGQVKGFARSSTDGGYVISGLLPGTYTVSASKVSYHDGSYPNPVQVVSGNVGGINLTLPSVQVGDVTGNGSIDVADVIFLIGYLYRGGSAPNPLLSGDTNCDGVVNTSDVIRVVNYLFREGASPCSQ
ncbi:MAG: carboxypeptidase regulatory-like domain-containing protein [Candidatus Zixiibacteriota bacterium]